jgi:hypothetical protein
MTKGSSFFCGSAGFQGENREIPHTGEGFTPCKDQDDKKRPLRVAKGAFGERDDAWSRSNQAVALARAAAMRALNRLAVFLWITFLLAALSAVEA